jgi:gas vesicle protein
MAFLPFADGLVLVSDVAAELSGPELELLAKARELCPLVILAQTKVDLYTEWRKIVDLNRGHLSRFGLSLETIALSSELRQEALRRQDVSLDQRSGYPRLLEVLGQQVIVPAKRNASERARHEISDTLIQLKSPLEAELVILNDPASAGEARSRFEEAKARLEYLRGPGARWSVHLGDSTTDLSNDVSHGLRGAVREIQREMDESIELLKTPEDWDDLAARLQATTAEALTRAFAQIEEGGRRIQEELVELLATDSIELHPIGTAGERLEVSALWRSKGVGLGQSKAGAALGTALTGLRGAQSGMIMLGMVGQFLPKGATLLLMSNPVTLGLGAAFAGMQLLDAHKHKIQGRRQQARTQVRQFLDDVQFEGGHRINEALRDLQRTLRDDFGDRIGELQRTYTEAAQQAQDAAQANQEQIAQRKKQIATQLAEIELVRARLGLLAPAS